MTDDTSEDALDHEAKSPLPSGLRLLAIEFEILWHGTPLGGSWTLKTESRRLLNSWLRCFEKIGCCEEIGRDETTLFGKRASCRIRLDVLATAQLLEKWTLLSSGKHDPRKGLTWRTGGDLELRVSDSAVLDSFAHRYESEDDEFEMWFNFKGIDIETFKSGDDFKPGDFSRWALTAQATNSDFEKLETLCAACNGDIPAVDAALDRLLLAPERPQSFLVEGLIPRGATTLLLGNRKVGKSALAMELAVAAARREKEWMGFPLNTSKGGFVVYLLGEDTVEEAVNRIKLMTGGDLPYLLWIITADGAKIDDRLSKLKERVSLLIVDPARKFFQGDEDGSDAVSGLFTTLETFARSKGCAVVVTHHLKKNATPRNISDVAKYYRGSGVFLDRPRVTLAMHRAGSETQFGIAAPDGVPLHNFRQSVMFSGVRRLRRDESTFRHVPIDAPTSGSSNNPIESDIIRVQQAAERLIGSGEKVTRTGRHGVFERKPPETAGLSRVKTRGAVEVLVADGRLVCDDAGVLSLPRPASVQSTVHGVDQLEALLQ
jgi:AAA domain